MLYLLWQIRSCYQNNIPASLWLNILDIFCQRFQFFNSHLWRNKDTHRGCFCTSVLTSWALTSHFFRLFVPGFSAASDLYLKKRGRVLRRDCVCVLQGRQGQADITQGLGCALTAHQWTIRPWLLMSCYLPHCRVTICSRCWRHASSSWRGTWGLKKPKGGESLKNEWNQTHTCTHNIQPSSPSLSGLHGDLWGQQLLQQHQG